MATSLNIAQFRASLGRFTTGVTVVSFDGAHGRHAFTVNSFTSVSLDPPLVLVSVARSARAHDDLRGRAFSVNVLGAEQERLAMHFAGRPSVDARWIEETGRPPRLADVPAAFQCEPWAAYDGGDHTLFLGRVIEFDYRGGDVLGFAGGRFITVAEPELGIEHLI